MTTKIDISSLDKNTQAKIEKMADRCEALGKGVKIELDVPKIENIVIWQEGTECTACYVDAKSIDWKAIQKQQDAIVAKYNAEIKEILDFADSCADRTEFFEQFLSY